MPVVAYDRLIETARRLLHHLRQQRGRPDAGARRVQGPAQGQLRDDQGLAHRPERQLPARRPAGGARRRRSRRATSRSSASEYTEGWKPEVAQKNMEQILTKTGNKVDAVVASNDGTAGGVVAALAAKGIRACRCPGQDGDHAALNRVALGTQTVSVWKDSRELGREAADGGASRWPRGKPAEKAADWAGGEKKVAISLAVPEAGADHARQPRRGRSRPAGSRRTSSARAYRRQGAGRLQVARMSGRSSGLLATALRRSIRPRMLPTPCSVLDSPALMARAVVMAIVFHVVGGIFLSPENLYNIAQQTAVVGIVVDGDGADHRGAPHRPVGRLGDGLRRRADRLPEYTTGWHWPAASLAGLAVALLVVAVPGLARPRCSACPRSWSRWAG